MIILLPPVAACAVRWLSGKQHVPSRIAVCEEGGVAVDACEG
jgi:hypothetical protein